MESKYCHTCGEQIAKSAPSCPKCGAPQPSSVSHALGAATPRSKTVAVVLALLIGGFGAHKFYLRRHVAGVLYLLFSWTYIPVFLAVGEGLRYALIKDETFDAEYNGGQPSNQSGAALKVVGVVGAALMAVMFVGILAAILVPAYHDYVQRAKERTTSAAAGTSAEVIPDDRSYAGDPPANETPNQVTAAVTASDWAPIGNMSSLTATAWQCASTGQTKQLRIFPDSTFVEHFISEQLDVVTFGKALVKGSSLGLHTTANVFLAAPSGIPTQRWMPAAKADSAARSNNVIAEYQMLAATETQLDLQPIRRVNWDGRTEVGDTQNPAWHCTPALETTNQILSNQRQNVPVELTKG